MKTRSTVSTLAVAFAGAAALAAAPLEQQQSRTSPTSRVVQRPTAPPPVARTNVRQPRLSGSTSLEVQVLSKEFVQWGNEVTINEPRALVFRWSTTQPGAASAAWQIWSGNPGGRSRRGAQLLREGALPGVATSPTSFQINLSGIIPQWPPASPGVYHYYVTVALESAQGQQVGALAPAVVIHYRAPADAGPINVCTSTQGCPPGHFCHPQSKSCEPLQYVCKYGYLIQGTDGSTHDCRPYLCAKNPDGSVHHLSQCHSSCQSTAVCAQGYVCNAEGQCVEPSR